jgi:pimeloyl-ACP methyl ester carboxylesterase
MPTDGVAGGEPFRCGYARTRRGLLHYAEAGEGPPLLLLGAVPRTYRCFRRALPLLAPRFRAIALDAPGFGNSHPLPSPTSVAAVAECLVDFLDALGIARTHVFGLHTGNKLAAALAAGWPERIDRLVLAGQTHSIILDRAKRNAAIRPWFDRYAPQYGESADGAHHVRDWAAAHAMAYGFWWPQKLLTGATVDPADVENAEARVIDYLLGRRSIVPMYEANFAFDLAAALLRIEAPTLVLELRTPQEAHLGSQAEAICGLMKRASPAVLDGFDGLVLEQRPEAIVDPVVAFLSG